MITQSDLKQGIAKRTIKLLNVAGTGDGKTHLSATFPKCYFMITEPGGEETFLNNPNLRKNIVGWDFFIPKDVNDTKRVFEELDKACEEARKLAEEGKIETLVLDNMTYLMENRWLYINKHTPQYSRSGEINTQAMYGELGRWAYQFTLMKLLSCPCNVVVNVHQMLESEEALEKKADQSSPILPNILGSFRDKVGGMFSCVFYLNRKKDDKTGVYKYYARTNKGKGKGAKNRYGLPEIIENISYKTIFDSIEKSLKEQSENLKESEVKK